MISGRILTLSVQAGVYLVVAVLLGRAWKLLGRAGVYLVGGGVVHAEVQKKQWNPGCLEEFFKAVWSCNEIEDTVVETRCISGDRLYLYIYWNTSI